MSARARGATLAALACVLLMLGVWDAAAHVEVAPRELAIGVPTELAFATDHGCVADSAQALAGGPGPILAHGDGQEHPTDLLAVQVPEGAEVDPHEATSRTPNPHGRRSSPAV